MNQNIEKARNIFNVDIDNSNIPQNVKEYVLWLEDELEGESKNVLYWCEKYSNLKDKNNDNRTNPKRSKES